MRYIPIDQLVAGLSTTDDGRKDAQRLRRAHISLARMTATARQARLLRSGAAKWTPIKRRWTQLLGNKCWYTETELVGASLTVDHFRPKARYWWLAYDPSNFRICCPFSNSNETDPATGRAGGKGASFPLLGNSVPARGHRGLRSERPLLLDPCRPSDSKLVAFQADGRPVLNPRFAGDAEAVLRFRESMVLLNLDHSDFNAARERIYHTIGRDVAVCKALAADHPTRKAVVENLAALVAPTAAFSSAARQYLAVHRTEAWVEQLLREKTV